MKLTRYRMFKMLLIAILSLGLCACGTPDTPGEPVDNDPSTEQPSDVTPEPEPKPDPIEIWVMDEPYGAKGDGVTDDRAAIQKAIDDAAAAPGGGIVYLNAGKTFCMGNILLRSNVELHFEDGAKILQSSDPMDFVDPLNGFAVKELVFGQYVNPEIEWDAAAYYNYPLIYATKGTENIKITGKGTIEMSAGEDPRGIMTMQAIGLFDVDGYELSEFTVQKYHAYCIKAVSCQNGLYKNLKIDITGGTIGGTDGINLNGCRNIRVTGCDLYTGDDGVYIASTYKDPREGLWYNCDHPLPIENIEIDNNHCALAWDETKAFAFILWGSTYPDQKQVEVNNIYIHDNYFESIGAWSGCWDLETRTYNGNGTNNPIKNVRFENNEIGRIQSNFYGVPISDVYGFDCMSALQNGDFSQHDIYWVSRVEGASGERDGRGYIDATSGANAALYQGLKLHGGMSYKLTADVSTQDGTYRLFVRDQVTQKLIASREVSAKELTSVTLSFDVPETGNYHVGLECGDAKSGTAQIDNVTLAADYGTELTEGNTVLSDQLPTSVKDGGGLRNELGFIFSAKVSGEVVAVRIYTAERESGIHYVSIWDTATGKLVTDEIYEWEIVPGYEGWREFDLPGSVSITAGKKYTISVSSGPDCLFSWGEAQLKSPIENGDLVTYATGGVYSADGKLGKMPTGATASNYFRDIVFIAD